MKSNTLLCKTALQVVGTLQEHDFIAYYAGGCVRDMLMGRISEDIDIATDASPGQVRELFPRSIAVGEQFGVVIVIENGIQFEVATFRQDADYYDGRRPSSIVATTPEEDAQRRDFTINGLFYDPLRKELYDYVEGRKDLNLKLIRAIGNPLERFQEDRLRMLRAVRFSVRFGYPIEAETEKAIMMMSSGLFPAVSVERVAQEFKKMILSGSFQEALLELERLGLLRVIFPKIDFDLLERIKHFHHMNTQTPLILYLLELFRGLSEASFKDLSYGLNLSNHDRKYIKTYIMLERLDKEEFDVLEGVRFYSQELSQECVEVVAVRRGGDYLKVHIDNMNNFSSYIERIKNSRPLVSSADLMECGVEPGRNMGILLHLAEDISIRNGLEDKGFVIKLLKDTEEWGDYVKD